MYEITCECCGKKFQSSFKVKICKDCKNRPCEVCGKPFVHEWPYDQHCCSKPCRLIWINDPAHKNKVETTKKANLLEKYGVDNVSKVDSVRCKISDSKVDKDNYFIRKYAEQAEKRASQPKLIRSCILCGKEFEAVGSQTTCTGPHFKLCAVCGKEFEYKHVSDKRKTCSEECRVLLRKHSIESAEKTCSWCGKIFRSSSNTAKYCNGLHLRNCVICGKPFELDFAREGYTAETAPRVCSSKCGAELAHRTNLVTYGVDHPNQLPESREKFRQQSMANAPERRETNFERYGVYYAVQTPEIRGHLSRVISSEENQAKMRATMQERYGVDYAMQSSELLAKQRSTRSGIFTCDGTRVDSHWEADFYNFLYRNDIKFEYNTQTIPYEYEGKSHVLHVDFKVGDILFEVKGDHLLEGVGDGLPITVKIALYKKYHVVLICASNVNGMFGKPNSAISNGLKYLNKCPEPLIGVDISLFQNPVFPFADDRPPCFYKVKVDGAMSSLEAFYNEKIRWNMIINRINYSGGFIDAKQVLNAMNITRTCKQPSWFSKTLAKDIIGKYCSSDTIVDTMAGWGMRHDAAVEMHRYYVGIDYNKEVTDWHQLHGRNIQWGDANEFKFDGDCSVFICPPYSDPATGRCFEDYNFDGFSDSAKALSQCDWLKIVMKNVPNAREYVMVCKVIDAGWQDYVVETLTNRSHFGNNNEYVIVVKQDQRSKVLSIAEHQ